MIRLQDDTTLDGKILIQKSKGSISTSNNRRTLVIYEMWTKYMKQLSESTGEEQKTGGNWRKAALERELFSPEGSWSARPEQEATALSAGEGEGCELRGAGKFGAIKPPSSMWLAWNAHVGVRFQRSQGKTELEAEMAKLQGRLSSETDREAW